MTREYRRNKRVFICFGAGVFTLFGFANMFFSLDSTFDHPIFFALVGLLNLAFAFYTGWVCLAYGKYRLVLTDEGISSHGIGVTQMGYQDITFARWYPEGFLFLKSPRCHLQIAFSSYPRNCRHELIHALRAAIPIDLQHGWSQFCVAYFR